MRLFGKFNQSKNLSEEAKKGPYIDMFSPFDMGH